MSETALTGRSSVEQANFEVHAEIFTQEQLIDKPLTGKIWQVLPGKEPGTFVVLTRHLICWTNVQCTNSAHNAGESSSKVVGMSPIVLGAIIGAAIGGR